SEPRRAVEEHVIEGLIALPGRGDRNLQVLADTILADVLVEQPRAQARFILRVFVDARGGHEAIVGHLASSCNACFSVRSNPPSVTALRADATAFSASGR